MIIGFTGTQQGMTDNQASKVSSYLRYLTKSASVEAHHGDCIGADKNFHDLCLEFGIRTVIHPPTNQIKRAFCESDLVMLALPYLERNHKIVESAERLIACPKEKFEVLRSGTWATVRFARKVGRIVVIIYPDGEVNV